MRGLIFGLLLMGAVGCGKWEGNVNSPDPTERGCSYIAIAIVSAAVIRAIFNS